MMKKMSLAAVLIFSGLNAQDTAYRLLMKLGGHRANLEAVAFSPDGKWLASGGWDNEMRLYKADTPKQWTEVRVHKSHRGAITCIAFSKDGKFVASGSKDFTIQVYETETGRAVFSANDHKDAVTRVLFDSKSKYVMSSSVDGTIRMYDLIEPKNNEKPRFIQYGAPINSFVPTLDGRAFFVASNKPLIEIVDFKAAVLRSLTGHSDAVNNIALSPDGKRLISGSNDKTVIVWDLTNGKVLKTLKGHAWKVTSVNWNNDGRYAVSTGNEGETLIWDVESGLALTKINKPGNNARCASFSADASVIAIATMMQIKDFGAVLYSTPLRSLKVIKKPNEAGTAKPAAVAKPVVAAKPAVNASKPK
jgi:WD40 repeat protein